MFTTEDDFYADLQFAIIDVPILVVIGDWNARTGTADGSTRESWGDSLLFPVVPMINVWWTLQLQTTSC